MKTQIKLIYMHTNVNRCLKYLIVHIIFLNKIKTKQGKKVFSFS